MLYNMDQKSKSSGVVIITFKDNKRTILVKSCEIILYISSTLISLFSKNPTCSTRHDANINVQL